MMKQVLSIAIALMFVGCQAQQESGIDPSAAEANGTAAQQMGSFEDVNVDEAKRLIAEGSVVLLDVRTDKEYASGHIEGTKHLDFFGQDFASELTKLPKDQTYVVYCASGNRSGKTVDLMKEMQFQSAHNMKGGITAWKSKQLETVK